MRNELLRSNWSRECTLTVHTKLNALSQLSMWTTGTSLALILEDRQQKYATNTATIRTPRRNRKDSVFWKDIPLSISPLALVAFGGSVKCRGVLKFKEIPAPGISALRISFLLKCPAEEYVESVWERIVNRFFVFVWLILIMTPHSKRK